MRPDEGVEVDAFAFVEAVPRCPDIGNGQAVDRYDDFEYDGTENSHTDKDVNDFAELLAGKDAEIQEEKCQLRAAEGREPEDLGEPCKLENCGQ